MTYEPKIGDLIHRKEHPELQGRIVFKDRVDDGFYIIRIEFGLERWRELGFYPWVAPSDNAYISSGEIPLWKAENAADPYRLWRYSVFHVSKMTPIPIINIFEIAKEKYDDMRR